METPTSKTGTSTDSQVQPPVPATAKAAEKTVDDSRTIQPRTELVGREEGTDVNTTGQVIGHRVAEPVDQTGREEQGFEQIIRQPGSTQPK